MYELPTVITIKDNNYPITNKGDYRMVIDCFNALQDETLDKTERILTALLIFYEQPQDISDLTELFDEDSLREAVKEMYNFFNCGQPTSTSGVNHKLIDWEQDSQLICGAVNKVANKEIRFEPYMHWWTFMGYYSNIGEGLLATIISIRDKICKFKQLEKYEKDFKRENPQYFVWNSKTAEQNELDNYVKSIWNKE